MGSRRAAAFAAFFLVVAGVAPAVDSSRPAWYPRRPVTLIVPFARGGGLDLSARMLARYAEADLGESIVVVNNTAGGNIAGNLESVRAEPDGYTLGVWGMGLVTDELVVRGVPYTHDDVQPLCMYAFDPHLIAASREFAERAGIETFADLMEYVRNNPGRVTFGSGGNWTSHDFVRLKAEAAAGGAFVRMPFLGGAPAAQAANAGNCDVVSVFLAEYLALPDRNGLVLLAAADGERLPQLPDLPTTAEQGYPGMVQVMWRVLTLPKGTPASLREYLEAVFRAAVENPAFVAEAAAMGINARFMGSGDLALFLEQEFAHFADMTRLWGIRIEETEAAEGEGSRMEHGVDVK